MTHVMLGSDVGEALKYTKRIDQILAGHRVGSGRYAGLYYIEQDVNKYINRVGRKKLAATVEGSALLSNYAKLARLEASERAISSARIVARAKTDEDKKIAKAKEQAKKDSNEAKRASDPDFTPKIDTGKDVLASANGGFNMTTMLIIGGVGLVGAFFLLKG